MRNKHHPQPTASNTLVSRTIKQMNAVLRNPRSVPAERMIPNAKMRTAEYFYKLQLACNLLDKISAGDTSEELVVRKQSVSVEHVVQYEHETDIHEHYVTGTYLLFIPFYCRL